MKVSRWGGSLAIRLPKAVVEKLGVREGDELVASESPTGGVFLNRCAVDVAAHADLEARRVAVLHALAPIRVQLPPDYRFDRDEANAR